MAALGRLCGHDNDRYFEKRARRLVALGMLCHSFHGYGLPAPDSDAPWGDAGHAAAAQQSPDMERDVLQALRGGRLAQRSGYVEGLDACLLGLCRRGLVERLPDGFTLTAAGRKAAR
jgi:hypothetical protein